MNERGICPPLRSRPLLSGSRISYCLGVKTLSPSAVAASPKILSPLSCRWLLVDSVGDRCNRIRVDYLIDLFAVIDHHEVQVHGTLTRRAVNHSRSGAIRVDGIGPRAWGPLDRGRDAVEDYVIHLRDIAFTVEVSHG
jgi:hypothetical protein